MKYDQHIEHNGGGWFAGTYQWDRIETVEQFIAENNLTQNVYSGAILDVNVANKITDDGKQALEGKQWVLRFAETEYSLSGYSSTGSTFEHSTLVGDVTILRLKFETDGIPYNLGVIDNKQSGSKNPINEETVTIDFDPLIDFFQKALMIIALILLLIVLGVFIMPIGKIFKFVFKSVVLVISLPFKLLSTIFKKRN